MLQRIGRLGDTPVYLLTTAVQALSPLLVLPLQRLSLGLEDTGMAVLATTMASFTGLIATMGVADAVLRRRLSGEVSPSEAIRIVRTVPLASIPIVAVISAIALLVTARSSDEQTLALVVGAVSGIFISTLLVCQQSVRADSRPWSFLLNVAMWHLLGPLVGIGLASSGFGFPGYIAGWAVTLAATSVVAELQVSKPHRGNSHRPTVGLLHSYQESIRLGFPILIHALAGAAVLLLDRSLLGAMHGGASIALYQAVYLIGLSAGTALTAINNAWAVRLFRKPDKERWTIQHRDVSLLSFVAALIVGVIVSTAEPVLTIILGRNDISPAMTGAVSVISSLALTQILYLAGMNALYFHGMTKNLARITLPCAVAQGSISALLIPQLGFLGPCVALIAVQGAQALLVWNTARRCASTLPIPAAWYFAALPVLASVMLLIAWPGTSSPLVGTTIILFALGGLAYVYGKHFSGERA